VFRVYTFFKQHFIDAHFLLGHGKPVMVKFRETLFSLGSFSILERLNRYISTMSDTIHCGQSEEESNVEFFFLIMHVSTGDGLQSGMLDEYIRIVHASTGQPGNVGMQCRGWTNTNIMDDCSSASWH